MFIVISPSLQFPDSVQSDYFANEISPSVVQIDLTEITKKLDFGNNKNNQNNNTINTSTTHTHGINTTPSKHNYQHTKYIDDESLQQQLTDRFD